MISELWIVDLVDFWALYRVNYCFYILVCGSSSEKS